MGDFGVFPAPGQADFLQQRHLHAWAENFQKVWYEKNFLKNFQKNIYCSIQNVGYGPVGSAVRHGIVIFDEN